MKIRDKVVLVQYAENPYPWPSEVGVISEIRQDSRVCKFEENGKMGSNWAGAIRKKKMRRTRREILRLNAKDAAADILAEAAKESEKGQAGKSPANQV